MDLNQAMIWNLRFWCKDRKKAAESAALADLEKLWKVLRSRVNLFSCSRWAFAQPDRSGTGSECSPKERRRSDQNKISKEAGEHLHTHSL